MPNGTTLKLKLQEELGGNGTCVAIHSQRKTLFQVNCLCGLGAVISTELADDKKNKVRLLHLMYNTIN